MASPLRSGHANGMLTIKMGLYRLPIFCGQGENEPQCRTNARQRSFGYLFITLSTKPIADTAFGRTGANLTPAHPPDSPSWVYSFFEDS